MAPFATKVLTNWSTNSIIKIKKHSSFSSPTAVVICLWALYVICHWFLSLSYTNDSFSSRLLLVIWIGCWDDIILELLQGLSPSEGYPKRKKFRQSLSLMHCSISTTEVTNLNTTVKRDTAIRKLRGLFCTETYIFRIVMFKFNLRTPLQLKEHWSHGASPIENPES